MKHSLGFGNGRIIEYEDGTAAYIKSMEMTQAFRVPIADVTGFSVVKAGKVLERTIQLMGGGTVLASVSVAHGTSERIEEWFRAHPAFRENAPAAAAHVAPIAQKTIQTSGGGDAGLMIADELRKLAELRDAGILSENEFAERKQLLLRRGT